MEKAYWLARKRAALNSAQVATSSEARLAHYDLAGRYSLRAGEAQTEATNRGDGPHPEKGDSIWP